MILFHFFYLAQAIEISTEQSVVVDNGKADIFWKAGHEDGYSKLFFDDVNNDYREFLIMRSKGQKEAIQLELKSHHVDAELSSDFFDLGYYGMGTFVINYKCKEKKYGFIEMKVLATDDEGEENEINLKWMKICEEIKTFTGSFIIASILGTFIVIIAVFLEKPETGKNESERPSLSYSLKNRIFGYSQYICFTLMLICYYFSSPDQKVLIIFLNVLSGLSLFFILKQKEMKNLIISNVISSSFGIFLFLLSMLVPNQIIQNFQFACISIFLIQSSKSLPFPMLILLSFLLPCYSIQTFDSDLYPSLSSSSYLELYENKQSSSLVIPFSFSTSSPYQVSLSLLELYLPGAFLIKFRASSATQDNFYFTVSLLVYLVSTISESLLRTYLNSSSLYLAGPILSILLIFCSLYRKEFKKVLFENKEPGLITNEIPMQQMSK